MRKRRYRVLINRDNQTERWVDIYGCGLSGKQILTNGKKGKEYVFGSDENKINPIHGKALAKVCIKASSYDMKKINAGGPDILSHNEILKIAFSTLGKPTKIS